MSPHSALCEAWVYGGLGYVYIGASSNHLARVWGWVEGGEAIWPTLGTRGGYVCGGECRPAGERDCVTGW